VPSWAQVAAEAPELAERARGYLDAHKHKTLATLRRDGSPRLSGIEAEIVDGELWMGMMPGSLKAKDLQRDGRFALHSASEDPPAWPGDAKVAGRAIEVEHDEPHHRFRCDITELVVVRVLDKQLVIESWHEGRGVRRLERD
jgi:Pyridoxamine 5'-phosphate oxidase